MVMMTRMTAWGMLIWKKSTSTMTTQDTPPRMDFR